MCNITCGHQFTSSQRLIQTFLLCVITNSGQLPLITLFMFHNDVFFVNLHTFQELTRYLLGCFRLCSSVVASGTKISEKQICARLAFVSQLHCWPCTSVLIWKQYERYTPFYKPPNLPVQIYNSAVYPRRQSELGEPSC